MKAAILAEEDRVHGGAHVVIDPAPAGSAEEGERPGVGVEHHLLGLARIGAQVERAAVAEPDVGNLDRHRQPTELDQLVRPVELVGVARRKHERHERRAAGATLLAPPAAGKAAHRVVAARVALPPQEIEQPLQRQPLPPRPRRVLRQHRFQPADERPQLRMRLLPTLVGELGRSRPDHLAHHLPRHPQVARDRLDALAPAEMLPPDPCNRLHHQHPPSPTDRSPDRHCSPPLGWGPYSTPITPYPGSFLHADPHLGRLEW